MRKALVLAFVLIAVAAVWPSSRRPDLKRENFTIVPVADIQDEATRKERDRQLELLRLRGWKIGETKVVQIKPKTPTGWWDRLVAKLYAEDYYFDGGYVSITGLDDGNPSTGEFWVHSYNWQTGSSIWGGVQWPGGQTYAWTFGEGAAGTVENREPGLINKWACKLTSTLLARPDSCGGGWRTTRDILLDGWYVGVGSTGAAYVGGCQVYTCLGASFLFGFSWQVYSDVFYLSWKCFYWY